MHVCVCWEFFWAHDRAFWDLLCCVTIVTHALICREGLSRRGSGRAGVGVWDFSDTKKNEGNPKFKHVVRSVFGRQLSFKEDWGLK